MAPPLGIVEVRCAGCEQTLEVEHGLMEFACPDCGTAQALPPELIPRRPRRALPLPRRGAPFAPTPSRVSCGGCGAVLSVPHGHSHFSCPFCAIELATSPAAVVSVIAPPASILITPSRPVQLSEVCAGPSSQSVHSGQLRKPIRSEQKSSFREESFSSFRADTGTEIPVIRRLQIGHTNLSSHREDSHTEYIFAAGTESFHARKVQEAHPNQDFHASEAQGMPSKSTVHKDKAEGLPNDTATMHSKQKTGYVVPSIIEHEQIKSLNHVDDVQQAGEISNNVVHADQAQLDFATKATGNKKKGSENSKANQKKRKNRSDMNSSNQLPHLRRSKRLVKGSPNLVDFEPIEKVDASTNQKSEAPCIDRTLADPNPSSPVQYRFPHGGSNEWDDVDTTTPPLLTRDAPQADQLQNIQMYSPETRWVLPVPSSDSWHEHGIPPESFSGMDQLNRDHEEVLSDPSETQNQDTDYQLTQEACSDKNRSGHVRLKPQNEKFSEGRQKNNGFTCPSSNDREHPEDRTFSETHHKTSLSASCSGLAALLPFSAATTLPTTMSPSSREYLPLSGTFSYPKRRGRAPEKLMEPHKEADRPVLTPSGTENWSVHPLCPKVANTLSLLIKQNYPGTYLSVDASKNSQPCEHVVYHWNQCPPDTRSTILTEFLKRYKWSPEQEEECQKIFDRKAVRQLFNLFCYEKQRVRQQLSAKKAKKSLMVHKACGMDLGDDREDSEAHQGDDLTVVHELEDPLKWKPFVPRWMKPKWWEMLCDHWATDEVMKVSYQKRKNRNSGNKNWNSGKRPCKTTTSRSIPIHQKQEAGGALVGSHPLQGEVGNWKRGRYCGVVGICNKVQIESLSKSSPGCVSKQGQQPIFTKEQVKKMINQALQGLNEVWEQKFLSLEQKMPGVSSLYAVPDGDKVSLGVAKRKQCQLSREDTLDSVDGENSPSARDDGDNQDEEEHSG